MWFRCVSWATITQCFAIVLFALYDHNRNIKWIYIYICTYENLFRICSPSNSACPLANRVNARLLLDAKKMDFTQTEKPLTHKHPAVWAFSRCDTLNKIMTIQLTAQWRRAFVHILTYSVYVCLYVCVRMCHAQQTMQINVCMWLMPETVIFIYITICGALVVTCRDRGIFIDAHQS